MSFAVIDGKRGLAGFSRGEMLSPETPSCRAFLVASSSLDVSCKTLAGFWH